MDFGQRSLERHKTHQGKLEVVSRVPLETRDDMSLAYTPGVAAVSEVIAKDPGQAYTFTMKGRTVAVVTDGSAVLGLGNIGPEAAMPVMEGKAILFKELAGVDAVPVCLGTQDTEELVRTIKYIAPTFGAINLEDIAAPRCFEIEERLREELDIPVVHDDQHGTAVVIFAGLLNALRVVKKDLDQVKIVISGSGAAGIAGANLLLAAGVTRLLVVDSKGVLFPGRAGMNFYKKQIAEQTNPEGVAGSLEEVLEGADVFIGVSQPGVLTENMIRSMSPEPIVFAMANPVPEIMPNKALEAGAAVVATGRSDFANQVNNALVFPGLFKGLLTSRTKEVKTEMFLRAAHALADMVAEPTSEAILPSLLDKQVARTIANAVQCP